MRSHVNQFDEVITVRTKVAGQNEGAWRFEHIRKAFETNVKPFAKTLKEYFHMFDQGHHKEFTAMKEIFNQMETEVAQCSIDKKYLEIEKKELIISWSILSVKILEYDNLEAELLKKENDRLLELIISQDLVHTAVNNLATIATHQNIEKSYFDEYNENLELQVELSKRNDMVEKCVSNKLSKKCARMENRSQLEAKNNTISKLKDHVATLKGKSVFGGHKSENISKVIASGMYKLDLDPLSPKLLKNREAHVDYLKHTQKNTDILCKIIEQTRALRPLDSDLDSALAFRKHTCYVRDLEGVDLPKGSSGLNFYTMSLEEMMQSSPIFLLSKASKTKSWLWHRRLSHLNFCAINDLAKQGLVRGLPKLKYQKDHLCSACSLGKSKKHTHKPKSDDSIQEKLYLLHMDLCGPMRIESINGKKYILVIVDDYSRFTWVKFLRSKDETPEIVIKLLKKIQVRLNATIRNI
ncbi:retrovirus-related pol polyprotein from transposon TNT 1-94 [Tanacetum coccineum]